MSVAAAGISDLAPLRPRLGALFALRLVLACSVLGITVGLPGTIPAPRSTVLTSVAIYLVIAVATDVVRHLRGTLPTWAIGVAVLIDGVFMTTVLTLGGGAGSSLSFLLYVHLVAVTLLASYRTGLKVAVWQSLSLVVAHYLPPSMTGVQPLAARDAVLMILAFLAVALVTAVCSALNESQLRRGRAGFQVLAEMATQFEQTSGPEEVVEVVLRSVPRAFTSRRAAVYLHDVATVTRMDNGRIEALDMPASAQPDLVVAQAWAEHRPVLRERLDAATNPVLARALSDARNVVVMPLTADGRSLGALVLEHGGGSATRIQASAVALLGQFAAHAALALRNARLLLEVQQLASADALTGLANRRTFENTLHREVARAVRTGEELSLLLVDVDHFKQVNDRHGHPMGDAVLRYVGRVLATLGREVDLPARYGGEEFAVILPACPPDEAVRVAERLRAGIAGDNSPVRITASVGVAAVPRNASTAEALVQAADAALYEAKQTGRNRTVAAGKRLHAVVA
jgi:two-component system, cell cycle response regulator